MGLSAAAYARSMKALLPPGKLWHMVGGVLEKLLVACAQELARVDQRALDLLEEADPRTTSELLAEYERELGLTASGTTTERRNRVIALLLLRQRVRPVDYKQILAPLLAQLAADVVLLETSRAQAIAQANDREIYRFFVYRDPSLPGTPDLVAAQAIIDQICHSHTQGHVITSLSFKCDDANSLCDRDRLGV